MNSEKDLFEFYGILKYENFSELKTQVKKEVEYIITIMDALRFSDEIYAK